ncbi:hypothetical protein CLCR_01007 [Cladophialophora carrionii]|uniref:Uncharacterized protein n=1 Tax=Cladophialophora carrionii TaxID=86049 RepID=A0A1C1D0Q4_9EURO|nr:hypothetical protein CLCR_01007 [Cladophialophora carrionii]
MASESGHKGRFEEDQTGEIKVRGTLVGRMRPNSSFSSGGGMWCGARQAAQQELSFASGSNAEDRHGLAGVGLLSQDMQSGGGRKVNCATQCRGAA